MRRTERRMLISKMFIFLLILDIGFLETAGEVICAREFEKTILTWPEKSTNSTHYVMFRAWYKDENILVASWLQEKGFSERSGYEGRLMQVGDGNIQIKNLTRSDSGNYKQISRFRGVSNTSEASVNLQVIDASASVCKPLISREGSKLKAYFPSDDVCATSHLRLEWKDTNKTSTIQNGTTILDLETDSVDGVYRVCAVGEAAKCFQGNISDLCTNYGESQHQQSGDGVALFPAMFAVLVVLLAMIVTGVLICLRYKGVICQKPSIEMDEGQKSELSQRKDYLQNLYMEMTYVPLSPVGEGTDVNVSELYINLDLEQIAARDSKKQNEQLPPIMIFGDSGSGKSTWCKHLVQCWSQNSKMDDVEVQCLNLPDLRKFQIVLYLPLKMSHQGLSFQELLQNSLFPDQQSYLEFVMKYMDEQNHFQSVLIVIDGLDKIEKKASLRLISELFNQKLLSSCAFILTSQPSIFKMIFDGGIDRSMKLFKIKKLTWKKSVSYAKRILSIKNHQNNTDFKIDNFLTFARYLNAKCLLESPYYCLAFLFVWMENSDPNIEITDILVHILENLLKRAMKGDSCKQNISKILQGNTHHNASIIELLEKHPLSRSFVCSLSRIADELFQSERKILTGVEMYQEDLATVACELGLITEPLSFESAENLPKLTFTNKLIYAFLVSIATELNKGPTFDYIVSDMDIALQNTLIIHMLCQLSPSRGKEIFDTVGKQMKK